MAEAEVLETTTTAEGADSVRVYEVGYHIIPTIKETELDGTVSAIRAQIEKIGGSFVTEGAPALMKLAYAMPAREGNKNIEHDRGYFGWIKFEAESSAINDLDEALKKDPNILRFIVFRTVREETRARMKIPTLREVKRTDVIRSAPRRAEEATAPVSEEDLDKAIEGLTID